MQLIAILVLLVTSVLANAAGFDCNKASSKIEQMICSDQQLSALDDQLNSAYRAAINAASNSETLKTKQKIWLLATRNECRDSDCLKRAYIDQINELNGIGNTQHEEENRAAVPQVDMSNQTQRVNIEQKVSASSITAKPPAVRDARVQI